ncbi:short-chain dehydrogenase [Heliocybe sulcata]|uniref:Short-chain dehydrogenase n=1 Tax=Heliocybe sulcata TaxID=5364 RepID=A0A5C3MWR2_9AGAM|nr:short-chain dehydrogenase [Heliocybe sulcata]
MLPMRFASKKPGSVAPPSSLIYIEPDLTLKNFIVKHETGVPPLVVGDDLTGKTMVVVGANTGIGLAAAKLFASMKASRVIMACRNEEKGTKAVAGVEEATGTKSAELWLVDLGKFSSIVEFCDRWEKEGGRLDILIMNAGIAVWGTWDILEGWESTLQINHLGTSLFSLLLLPRLQEMARESLEQTRLVFVGSDTHYFVTINEYLRNSPSILRTLNDKEKASLTCQTMVSAPGQDQRYPISKLLNLLFSRSLAARLGPSSQHPSIEHEGRRIELHERTSEQGAYQLMWAALGPTNPSDNDHIRGAYVVDNEITEPSDFVISKEGHEVQERIRNETIEILRGVAPKISEIVDQSLRA